MAKECGFIMRTGTACTSIAKHGVRCGRHKGKRNKPVRKSTKTTKRKVKKTLTKRKKTRAKPRKTKADAKKKTKKTKKTRKTTTKKTGRRKAASSRSKTIEFYDVSRKKRIRVPREAVRVKRANPSRRGGDQLVAKYKGRKLYKFVKRGFIL